MDTNEKLQKLKDKRDLIETILSGKNKVVMGQTVLLDRIEEIFKEEGLSEKNSRKLLSRIKKEVLGLP